MKKMQTLLITFFITVSLLISGCSNDTTENNDDAGQDENQKEQVTLRIAHGLSEGHPTFIAFEKMAKEIEEESEGTLILEVFPGATLGGENDVMDQVRSGTLDAAHINGVDLFQGLDPRLAVQDLPFLFESREHAYKAMDGAFGDKLSEIIGEHNMKVLAFWENGFRHFTNSKRPIIVPEDLKGLKLRSAPSDIRLEMFKQLDASAIPMDFTEVYTALQQGTVDGQENPLSVISSYKLNEVQDYLSLSGHIWTAAPVVINPKVFDGLSDTHKEILQNAAIKFADEQRQMVEQDDEELVEELEASGMEVNEVDTEVFRETVMPVWDIYIQENGDELIELVEAAK